MTIHHLCLFSGYGGFPLGLKISGEEVRTIGYIEIEPYAQKVLQARIRDGYLDWAPIINDIRGADCRPMASLVGLVTASFPCQPFSVANHHAAKGANDPRNLWPETLRVIGEVEPYRVLLENVPHILARGYGGVVVGQLSEIGYDCRWGIVSAAETGAPHLRKRWWVEAINVEHAQHDGLSRTQVTESPRPRA
jgi:DNA (cytosine-5)-methyltransferase 1